MFLYRQAIILFGIVIPLLIAAAVLGTGYFLKSKMADSFASKQENFKTYTKGRMRSNALESNVIQQRDDLKRWNELLSQETASAAQANLRQIYERLPSKEIQQTVFEPQNSSGGFGNASAQNSSQIRIAFRGTFRTVQQAFFELETKMPQLQLQDFKISPINNSSSLMNFQASFTAWEN